MTKLLADRFNEDKLRYDLIPPSVLKALAEVFTYGAKKYGEHNWEKGLSWSSVLASAFRHFEALRSGEDYDESGCLHAANLMANIAFIIEYYKSHPELDDRPKIWNSSHDKIGLDLDGVIFDFESAYEKRFNIKMTPYWAASYQMKEHLKILEDDKDFWVNLPVLHKPEFEVTAYITSRCVPVEWIEESIEKNGLPCAPIYTVPWNESKLPLLKELSITKLIDDKYENFKEANNNGITCYLMDGTSNRYYNVGSRRIYDLKYSTII